MAASDVVAQYQLRRATAHDIDWLVDLRVQTMAGYIRASGHASVVLSVLKVNPAKRLYRRLGFRVAQEKERSLEMIAAP